MMDAEGWIPCRIVWDQDRPLVDWCYLGGVRFSEPFFHQTMRRVMRRPFSAAFQRRAAIDEWDDTATPDPSGLIFHMSRCGSTLISQMLKAIPSVTVFSEPAPVDVVVRASEFRIDVSEEQHAKWLRAIVRALGSGFEQRAYFLKLDCWHAVDLALFRRAFPSVPWIFLYRNPLEVLASHATEPSEWTDRGFLKAERFGFDPAAIPPAALAEYRTHLLVGILRRVLEYGGEREGHLVNYSQLPEWGWTTLPRLFGVDPSAQEIAAMREVATQDAKRSAFAFAPDAERKRAGAPAELHALSEAHLYPLYRKLEARIRLQKV
jgi:hypothetical protein